MIFLVVNVYDTLLSCVRRGRALQVECPIRKQNEPFRYISPPRMAVRVERERHMRECYRRLKFQITQGMEQRGQQMQRIDDPDGNLAHP